MLPPNGNEPAVHPSQNAKAFARHRLEELRRVPCTGRQLTAELLAHKEEEGKAPKMLRLIPLDEVVTLTVIYEFNTEAGAIHMRSPMSRSTSLRYAVGLAMSYSVTNAKVSITARGITYRDAAEFRRVWARRNYFQGSQ